MTRYRSDSRTSPGAYRARETTNSLCLPYRLIFVFPDPGQERSGCATTCAVVTSGLARYLVDPGKLVGGVLGESAASDTCEPRVVAGTQAVRETTPGKRLHHRDPRKTLRKTWIQSQLCCALGVVDVVASCSKSVSTTSELVVSTDTRLATAATIDCSWCLAKKPKPHSPGPSTEEIRAQRVGGSSSIAGRAAGARIRTRLVVALIATLAGMQSLSHMKAF